MDDKTGMHWRSVILRVCVGIFIVVLIVECIIFVGFCLDDAILVPLWKYVSIRIVLPTIVNFSIISAGYLIDKRSKLNERAKNFAVMIGFTMICLSVACFHSYFVTTLVTFSMPVIATGIFSDKRLTDVISVTSLLGIFSGYFLSLSDGRSDYHLRVGELIIAVTILLISFALTRLLVEHNIENQQLLRTTITNELKLKEQLNIDYLTQLYNYSTFVSNLDREVINYSEKKETLTLAVIDLDNFKNINDTYGHETGNAVLKEFASLLSIYCSTQGFPARYGGEEFAVLFYDVSAKKAAKALERVRIDLRNVKFDGIEGSVTFSCGIAEFKDEYSAKSFFIQADDAMYAAKKRGKDCTVFDTEAAIQTLDI